MNKLLAATLLTTTALTAPAHAEIFTMQCTPESSAPYTVSYNSGLGNALITSLRGTSRRYHVLEVTNSPGHVLHVATHAAGQTRMVYLAFNYSGLNDAGSAIRVIDGAYNKQDQCTLTSGQHADAAPVTYRSAATDRAEAEAASAADRTAAATSRVEAAAARAETAAANAAISSAEAAGTSARDTKFEKERREYEENKRAGLPSVSVACADHRNARLVGYGEEGIKVCGIQMSGTGYLGYQGMRQMVWNCSAIEMKDSLSEGAAHFDDMLAEQGRAAVCEKLSTILKQN